MDNFLDLTQNIQKTSSDFKECLWGFEFPSSDYAEPIYRVLGRIGRYC